MLQFFLRTLIPKLREGLESRKLRDQALNSSISVTALTALDSTNTACSATPKLHHNFYLPNSGVQKTQGFSQGLLCHN